MTGREVDLFGGEACAPLHRLFFAMMPADVERSAIRTTTEALRSRIPQARWLNPSRHHLTLNYLGESAGRREDWISAARKAVEGWKPGSFEVTLDHLRALGNPRWPALALTASSVSPELETFWRELRVRMARAGFRGESSRTLLPHLTVAYTAPGPPPLPDVAPVQLRASAYWLVLSIEHEEDYLCLGEWPFFKGVEPRSGA